MGGSGSHSPDRAHHPATVAIRSMVPNTGIGIGSGHHHLFGSSFHMEHSLRPVMVSHGDRSADAGSRESEKKRGRPSKYGLDASGGGSASSAAHHKAVTPGSGSGSAPGLGWSLSDPSQKRGRGRPPAPTKYSY